MPNQSRRRIDPINAFRPDFLHGLESFDWPVSLGEGQLAGPWVVAQTPEEAWTVRHEAEDAPFAVCQQRETALMVAAILPAAVREPIYELVEEELMTMWGDRGFESIATFRYAEEDIVRPLHTVHCLLASPSALAFLLVAAPPETLARAQAQGPNGADHRAGRQARSGPSRGRC